LVLTLGLAMASALVLELEKALELTLLSAQVLAMGLAPG